MSIRPSTSFVLRATPKIEIDPETFAVMAGGELLVREPAERLAMAQRYFLFERKSTEIR